MEASALPASVGLGRSRIAVGVSLLRIRTDEQLVTLFRAGHDEAFRVIHDRYRARLVAYTRQMLAGTGQDAEDAVQDIFMRAYYGLRANDRELALRAWLYRIAHNRCVDDLRRPQPITVDTIDTLAPSVQDPVVKAEQRDALWRLIADVQRLPDQQRSALLMRELSGMPYADVSGALGVSVPAVKSLLVRARVSLAQASEARDTSCARIRQDLIVSHDRGVRTSGLARRHMRECDQCRQFRAEVRGVSRSLAALAPTLGPLGVLAHLLGWGGGGGAAASSGAAAGGGVAAGGGAAVVGGATGTGAAASAGLLAGGATHMVTILAAAVVTAGGAVELQTSLSSAHHRIHHHPAAIAPARTPSASGASGAPAAAAGSSSNSGSASASQLTANTGESAGSNAAGSGRSPRSADPGVVAGAGNASTRSNTMAVPLTQTLDPDHLLYAQTGATGPTTGAGSTSASGTPTGTGVGATGNGAAGATSPPTGSGTGTTVGSGTGPSTGSTAPATGTGGTTQASPTGPTSAPSAPSGSTSATGSATGTGSTGSGYTSSTGSGTSSGSSTTTKPVVSTKPTVPNRTRSGAGKRHRKRKVLVGRLLAR